MTKSIKLTSQLLRRSDGQALIEVALFLPIMILMLIGVLDFGVLLNQYLRVADSARSASTAATTYVYANNMDYVRLVGNSSATGIPGYSIAATQYCLCAPGSAQFTCSSHTACGSYGVPNQYVQVTATAQLPLIFSIVGFPSVYNVKSVAIARTPWTGTY
jgi:Flp pilus assembly protein TadG